LKVTRAPGLVLGGILFIVTAWVFLPAASNDFIGYDDPLYVTANRHVLGGLTWNDFVWAFKGTGAGNYHPLTWLSHQVDSQFFGLRPAGHHFTSIIIHALNTALAFALLQRLTSTLWPSFAVAALFGLHPLRVESVAWIAERKDVLCTLFVFLSLLAYSAFVRCPESERRNRMTFYLLSAGAFCAALLSKPMAVTLPCLLLLLDFWPLDRFKQSAPLSLLLEKVPFFFIAAIWGCITIAVQKSAGALVAAPTFADRLANTLNHYARYLGKIVFPTNLAVFYPPTGHLPWTLVLVAAAILALVSGLALALRRKQPWFLMGWLWFLIGLLPVIGLIQAGEQSIADRYTYVPSLGILVILVWGVRSTLSRIPMAGAISGIGFLAAAISLTILTRIQLSYWATTETLFTHALKVTEHNYIAHINLGTALEKTGHLDEASRHFQMAIQDKPTSVEAHNDLGVVYQKQSQPQTAFGEFFTALSLDPHYAEAHYNLGVSLSDLGHLDEAASQFRQAVADSPDYPEAHYNLAGVLSRQGHIPEAIAEYQVTLRLDPNSPDAHNNLAAALLNLGRLDEAIAHCQAAIRLKPDYARAHFNLGVALAQKGDLDAAIAAFRQTLALKPDYYTAQTNLNLLLEKKGLLGPR
jgi:tetratricopeptide (TPR) repeat protein